LVVRSLAVISDSQGGTCVAVGIAFTVATGPASGWTVLAQYKTGANISTNLLSKSEESITGPFFQEWSISNASIPGHESSALQGGEQLTLSVQCNGLEGGGLL